MRKVIASIVGICLCFLAWTPIDAAPSEQSMMSSVLKIKTYKRDPISGNYNFVQWGSAVLLDKDRIVTNAHVVLDSEDNTPTGYYEICRAVKAKTLPVCFTTAKLISYDSISDLALLKLSTPFLGAKSLRFSEAKLSIGSSMIIYGYPAIGGSNITRTEGKIGGSEGENYKFDGTIDHGNSGGGAFGPDGKLVGIPYAVSSDNGVIGYIIPAKTVIDFIAGKSYDNVSYAASILPDFASYTRSLQALSKNENQIKTPYFELKDAQKSGFTLKVTNSSVDGKIFDYRFIDKNTRVALIFSCSQGATSDKSYIELQRDMLDDVGGPTDIVLTGAYIDVAKKYYLITGSPKKEKNGEKVLIANLLYTDAPTCDATIIANDGMKKDKALYEKALSLAQTARFPGFSPVTKSFRSAHFGVETVPKGFYIGNGFGFDDYEIEPRIIAELDSTHSTDSTFTVDTYTDLDGYMNFTYSSTPYTGKSYTFETFYSRYGANNGPSVIKEEVIRSADMKKLVFSVIDQSYGDDFSEDKKTAVYVYYPFRSTDGKLYAYRWSFEYTGTNSSYSDMLRRLFESITLPGTSPFEK